MNPIAIPGLISPAIAVPTPRINAHAIPVPIAVRSLSPLLVDFAI